MALNNSAATCGGLPIPLEAQLSLSGLAFACAMNSGTERAGKDGLTHMTIGVVAIAAIGSVSRMKLNLRLRYRVALIAFEVDDTSKV